MLIGYLVFDFLLMLLYIKTEDNMTKQYHFHHVMTTVSILIAMISGYGLSGIANLLLMMEFSTVALNYRNMYSKENFGDSIPTCLQYTFFLQFIVFRVILMPFAYYKLVQMI